MVIKNTCIIILIMIAGLASVPQLVHASPPSHPDEGQSLDGVVRCVGTYNQYHCIRDPSFDGFGTCVTSVNAGGYDCHWQSLTTGRAEDVIILVVRSYTPSDTPSIIDSAGLKFTLTTSYATSEAPGIFPLTLWEYYATADSPLTSDNITALSTLELLPIQVFAIHPDNTETIFDPNPSLPIAVTCPGLGPLGNQSCSASAGPLVHDFVIAITAINDAPPCPGLASSGFSELVFDGSTLDIQYQIVGRSQSNVIFTCAGGEVSPNTDPMAMVLDAISLHSHRGADDSSDLS